MSHRLARPVGRAFGSGIGGYLEPTALGSNRFGYLFPAIAVALGLAVPAFGADWGRPLSSFEDCNACPEMVVVPAGSFLIGSPSDEEGRRPDEGPQEEVSISEFAIGKYEVTFAQYDAFANATGRKSPSDVGGGRGNKPVVNVSLNDAVAYTRWLSDHTGESYRLPTSAEWEYAARAGSATRYPWGDGIGDNLANCAGCGSKWDAIQSAPVGSFPANAWGIHDTVGNVWEWTCSRYEASYAGEEQECNGTEVGPHKIVTRSGAYDYPPHRARSAFHHRLPSGATFWNLGFRVVRGQ